jgi:hypothetical protein
VCGEVPFNEYGRNKLIAGASKARLQPGRKKDLVVGAEQPLTPIYSVKGATRSILIMTEMSKTKVSTQALLH